MISADRVVRRQFDKRRRFSWIFMEHKLRVFCIIWNEMLSLNFLCCSCHIVSVPFRTPSDYITNSTMRLKCAICFFRIACSDEVFDLISKSLERATWNLLWKDKCCLLCICSSESLETEFWVQQQLVDQQLSIMKSKLTELKKKENWRIGKLPWGLL